MPSTAEAAEEAKVTSSEEKNGVVIGEEFETGYMGLGD